VTRSLGVFVPACDQLGLAQLGAITSDPLLDLIEPRASGLLRLAGLRQSKSSTEAPALLAVAVQSSAGLVAALAGVLGAPLRGHRLRAPPGGRGAFGLRVDDGPQLRQAVVGHWRGFGAWLVRLDHRSVSIFSGCRRPRLRAQRGD